jgi:hypothetical protein
MRPASRPRPSAVALGLALFWGFRLSLGAWTTGQPIELVVIPAVVKQGDQVTTTVKTEVTLRSPAPCYFICEVRSSDKGQLDCKDIIFRKGDLTGSGTATIDWDEVTESTTVEVSAFSVDAPDKAVRIKVTLQRKDDSSS